MMWDRLACPLRLLTSMKQNTLNCVTIVPPHVFLTTLCMDGHLYCGLQCNIFAATRQTFSQHGHWYHVMARCALE